MNLPLEPQLILTNFNTASIMELLRNNLRNYWWHMEKIEIMESIKWPKRLILGMSLRWDLWMDSPTLFTWCLMFLVGSSSGNNIRCHSSYMPNVVLGDPDIVYMIQHLTPCFGHRSLGQTQAPLLLYLANIQMLMWGDSPESKRSDVLLRGTLLGCEALEDNNSARPDCKD